MISKPTGRSYCSAGRHWMSDRCRHQLVKCPSPSRCPWCDADLQVGGNIRAREDWCAFGPVPVRPSDALVKERHARGKRQEARLPAPTTLKSGRYRARGRLCIFVILRQTTTKHHYHTKMVQDHRAFFSLVIEMRKIMKIMSAFQSSRILKKGSEPCIFIRIVGRLDLCCGVNAPI